MKGNNKEITINIGILSIILFGTEAIIQYSLGTIITAIHFITNRIAVTLQMNHQNLVVAEDNLVFGLYELIDYPFYHCFYLLFLLIAIFKTTR